MAQLLDPMLCRRRGFPSSDRNSLRPPVGAQVGQVQMLQLMLCQFVVSSRTSPLVPGSFCRSSGLGELRLVAGRHEDEAELFPVVPQRDGPSHPFGIAGGGTLGDRQPHPGVERPGRDVRQISRGKFGPLKHDGITGTEIARDRSRPKKPWMGIKQGFV
jgi:hypothetical protein